MKKMTMTMLPNRREFFYGTAGAMSVSTLADAGLHGADKPQEGRRLRYVGWQVGLTYQSERATGLDRDYFLRLLDEMAAQRMNLLSIMMQSYAYFDPQHDGYAWPVRHPKLLHYLDPACSNGRRETEFLREVIRAAADRRIEVHLFLNWGIWNPERILLGYPSAVVQADREGKTQGWLHCPDAPGAWQAGLDEVKDLLEFYDHPNVKGFALERVGFQGRNYCHCPYTRRIFQADTGGNLAQAEGPRVDAWKREHVGKLLAEYVREIHKVRPGLTVGLHSQCAPGWGHDASRMQACGIDMLLPHTVQFEETEESLHALISRLAPNPCLLHFCTRDRRPANYKLWIKTPEIINRVFAWIGRYQGNNIHGFLFFNEPATSPTNKAAVYENLKRFTW